MRSILLCIALCLLMAARISAEAKKSIKPSLADIMLAIIEVESGGNPRARRFEPHLVERYGWESSWAYSYGLTQVVYGFHYKRCGLKSPEDLYNAKTNIKCGTKIFKDCLSKEGSLNDALGCYNGDRTGKYAGRVRRALVRISPR